MSEHKNYTDVQLFEMKNEKLRQSYKEVTSMDFYRDIFPVGSFERKGHFEDERGNGIITVIDGEKARNYLVFDDLDTINNFSGCEFAIISPVGYCGRNRTAKNARWLYGIAIDLDGVELPQMRDLFYQMQNKILPQCTYCINSGHGLHLYYLFERPVPLYKHLQDKLRDFKYELIAKIWNRFTSTYTERDQVQYQGIFQGFRIVGTQTKLGSEYLVTAFKTGDRVTVEYLNDFLMDKSKAVTDFYYKSDLSLKEAKEKYPEWYERRIVRGEKRGKWHIKRDLYDWWLRKIQSGEVTVGHRYWCLSVLASFAIKCDIPEDEVLTDALGLISLFDEMSDDDHNRFTKRDVLDAMNMYQESYATYSRAEVERVSGISVPPNKRNGRKQADHIKLMNFVRDEINGNKNWRDGNGRKPKNEIVYKWRVTHKDGKKSDCVRDTGLTKPTVYKWWDYIPPNVVSVVDNDFNEVQYISENIVAECQKIAAKYNISEEEAYEMYKKDMNKVQLVRSSLKNEELLQKGNQMIFSESEYLSLPMEYHDKMIEMGIRPIVLSDIDYEMEIAKRSLEVQNGKK